MKIIKHNLMLTVSMILLCCGMLFVITACTDNGDGSDNGGNTTYTFMCPNGTAATGATADTDGDTNCASCNAGYREDGVSCALNRYICDNGTPATATDSDKPDSDQTVQKCSGCTGAYLLNSTQQCEAPLTIVEQLALEGDAGTTSATVAITASKTATVRWVVYANDSSAPADATALINDAVGSDAGVVRSGTDPMVTTNTTDDGVTFQLSVGSLSSGTDYDLYVALTTTTGVTTEQVLSNKLDFRTAVEGTPEFDGLITVTTTQTTATLTFNANDSNDTSLKLYWVLYATSQDKDEQQIIDDAQANGGIQRDDTDTIAPGSPKQLEINELTPQQTYYFYAVIADDDIATPAVRSAPVTIITDGYEYICKGGTKAGGTVATENTTKCTECDPGFTKEGDSCNADIIGIWEIDDDVNFGATAACLVTFVADGSVEWNGACTDYSPINSYDSYEVDANLLIFNKSSGVGKNFQHDFTIDRDDSTGVFTMNPHSTTLNGNHYLRAYTPPAITTLEVSGTIGYDSSSFSVTAATDSTLYWVVYTDGTAAPSASQLITNSSDTTAGAARSDGGSAVTAGNPSIFTASGLTDETAYDLYVLLDAPYKGVTQQVLQKFDFSTVAILYECANGTPEMGTAPAAGTVLCTGCDTGYSLITGECFEDGVFSRHHNGVTIVCPGVANLGTGEIDGVTYTKRNRAQILADNGRTQAATTCTTGITDMSDLLRAGTGYTGSNTFNEDITHWDVSKVTNMNNMFQSSGVFNQPIGVWDVSKVTTMINMFFQARKFNRDIGSWNVGNVRNMSGMFWSAVTFDQDIGSWNVSNVTNMSSMFTNTTFNQNLNQWNVGSVTTMRSMFTSTSLFNGAIDRWNVSSVTDMSNMFNQADSFKQPIGSWDVSSVTDMNYMFEGSAFNQDISGWDVSSVTTENMVGMFHDATDFNAPGTDSFGVRSVPSDLSGWCVQQNFDSAPPTSSTGPISVALPAFDEGTVQTWGDDEKPQWTAASCPISFAAGPAIDGSAGATTTINLTSSATSLRRSRLYWILYSGTDPGLSDTTALKTAIGNSAGVQRSSSSGILVTPKMEQDVALSGLSSGTTYYFYAGMEVSDKDGMVLGSVLSDVVTIAP